MVINIKSRNESPIPNLDSFWSRQPYTPAVQMKLDFTSAEIKQPPSQNPQPLLPKQRKNGFDYQLVQRDCNVCIYRQVFDDQLKNYEVFRVKIREASVFKGKELHKREVFPSDEDFGSTAWSCRSLEDAQKRMRILVNRKPNQQNY